VPFQNRSVPASGARASHPSSVITFALQELSWVPSVGTRFPDCLRESRFRFSFQVLSPVPLREPLPVPLRVLSAVPLRVPLPVPRSSFPDSLASAGSGSPEVPSPALLREPLRVLRWLLSALSYWRIAPLLIRKVLANCAKREWVLKAFFCGNMAVFVEMRPKWAYQFVCGERRPNRLCNCLR
jgi:hypothetical protein